MDKDKLMLPRGRLADVVVWVLVGGALGAFWREMARMIASALR